MRKWLHREQQAQQLKLLLHLPSPPDILIHGPSCTGKTSIVRQIIADRPHAYISCCRSLKLRSLLSSVVSQLTQSGKRKRAQAFAAAAGTEHSLIWELKAACPADQACKVLVLDEMQQLLVASDGPLGPLLALKEQAGVNLCLVMISRQQPAALGLLGLLPGVVMLSCPAYTDMQLVDILAAMGPSQTPAALAAAAAAGFGPDAPQQQQQQELQLMYRRFLVHTLVPQFQRLSRCLPDIASQAAALWPKYLSGASRQQQQQEGGAAAEQDDTEVDQEARMYTAVSGKLQSALSNFQPAVCCVQAAPVAGGRTGKQQQRVGLLGAHMAAGLELSRLSKLLLVAAFLASRNKPSVDKQLFQQGTGGWRGRGNRRRNVLGADRQAEAAKAAELKGPHTFSLARLLNIYSHLLAADDDHGSGPAAASSSSRAVAATAAARTRGSSYSWGQQQSVVQLMPSAGWMGVQRSDVLMGVNTLVVARLMSQACDDVLDAARYSCEAPQELVEQLALDLGVNLTSYLKYV